MQELVIAAARGEGCMPTVVNLPAEMLDVADQFDFAFSINVMEHVRDVRAVIGSVLRALKPGASYHFTCPNYHFPYEPHFDMPTLFGKRLTARVLAGCIAHKENMPDPWGTWNSLNWINVLMISKAARALRGVKASFNRGFLVTTLERVGSDAQFTSRRSAFMQWFIPALVKLRIHRVFGLVPAVLQPTIDCRLTRAGRLKGAS